jgi:hypothetical protein
LMWTRVDSVAKHIMPAKVDTNLMKILSGSEGADLQTMHQKKLELMTEKDDLILNVSRKLSCLDTRTFHTYPAVVSTLANCTEQYQRVLTVLYSMETVDAFFELIERIQKPARKVHEVYEWMQLHEPDTENHALTEFMRVYPTEEEFQKQGKTVNQELAMMPYYQLQGYSLGRAYASPISGDTVFSVLIGGCVTTMNGHFAMHAGQLVQWYFDFEEEHFSTVHDQNRLTGQRCAARAARVEAPQMIGQKRRRMEEPRRKNFCFPKPYVPGRNGEVYANKIRIFGKCLNGAGPFEPVDIMIMTQIL